MKKCSLKRAFLSLISFLLVFSFPSFKVEAYEPKQVLDYIEALDEIYCRYNNFETKSIIDKIIYSFMDLFKYAKGTNVEFDSIGEDAKCFIISRVFNKCRRSSRYRRFLDFDKFKIDEKVVEPIINLGKDKYGKYWVIVEDKKSEELSFVCV